MFYKLLVVEKKRKYLTVRLDEGSRNYQLHIDAVTNNLVKNDEAFAYLQRAGDDKLTAVYLFASEDDLNKAIKLRNRVSAFEVQARQALRSPDLAVGDSGDELVKEYRLVERQIANAIENEGWLPNGDVAAVKEFVTFRDILSKPCDSELDRLKSFEKAGLKWGAMAFMSNIDSPQRLFTGSINICVSGTYYSLSNARSYLYNPSAQSVQWGAYLQDKAHEYINVYFFRVLGEQPKEFDVCYLDGGLIPDSALVLM